MTERDDSSFWDYCRNLTPPDSLVEAMSLFAENGLIFRGKEELFRAPSWLAVLAGQGIEPKGYHPAADMLSDEETLTRLRHIREVIAGTVAKLPTQREFLALNNSASNVSMRVAS